MCSCFCGFKVQSSETEFDAHTPEFPSPFLMAPIKFSADKTDRKEEPKTTKEKFLFSKKKVRSVVHLSPLCPSGNNSPEWGVVETS